MAVQEFSDWRIEPVSNRISETLPTSFDSEFQLLRGSEQKFNETATALFENEDLVFDVSKQDNEENLLDDIYGNLELLGQVTGKFSLEWLDSQN
jgi:glutamine synthetase